MKYIKQYNESLNNNSIDDIRDFFSNLKLFSYHFEDYYNFNKLKEDIEMTISNNSDMPFFGYTNLSMYIPILGTITKQKK